MVGEGLGRGMTAAQRDALSDKLFGGNTETGNVASIGEFIQDRVIPLGEEHVEPYVEEWQDEDWFPQEGESVVVDEMPAYVQELATETFPGGRGANQAVAASMSGADTDYIGRIGEDRSALASMAERGVSLDHVNQVFDRPTSQAYIFRDEQGENRIACYKPGGDLLDEEYLSPFLDQESDKNVLDADYLLLTNGESDEVLHYVLSQLEELDGPRVIFDPAPTDGADAFLEYDCVDIVTPNEVEYDQLADEMDAYDGTVIQTSSGGATIDNCYHVDAPKMEAVDTTGAGDTFNGYLAGGLAAGKGLHDATEYAVHAASLSVTREGAQESVPTMEEVEVFLQGVNAR